jgi:hypothetical protein
MTTEQIEQIEEPEPIPAVGADGLPLPLPPEGGVVGPPVEAGPQAEAPMPPGGIPGAPPSPQYSPEQIAQMQQAAAEYQQVQGRAAMQNQIKQEMASLEAAGFLPEQAEQVATSHAQMQAENQNLIRQGNEYGSQIRKTEQDKQTAVEFFVKKYNLGIDDQAALRAYNDPKSMDDAAKKMSVDRERDAELSRLRQGQVPAQSFDNSQGNPQVAADEGRWLDAYNSGDRSPSAVAAARRVAGFS